MNNDLKRKKLFVLDMDGTIYLDETPIDGAREFISTARRHGVRIVYFTNNASKSISMYYDRLRRLGFEADDGDVVSSADVTIDFIKRHHAGQSVYLVGTPALEKSFREAGITLTDGESADIVVSSFDTTVTYEKLDKACHLIRGGSLFYSTHPDLNCPVKKGFVPDSGAICALITASTGVEPRFTPTLRSVRSTESRRSSCFPAKVKKATSLRKTRPTMSSVNSVTLLKRFFEKRISNSNNLFFLHIASNLQKNVAF